VNILVTGAAGYIGSSLCPYLLQQGYSITAIDNLMYNQGPFVYQALKDCNFIIDDVRNLTRKFIRQFDVIIPLAALVGAPICKKYPDKARSTNLDTIKWLCKNITDFQLIISPNTNSGYGRVLNGICTENTPLNSISLYGQLKDDAEKELQQRGNSIIFRLATVFGVSHRMRLDLLINTLVLDGLNGEITLFDGNFNRNYIHIKDIIKVFDFAIRNRKDMIGQVYNVGNDSINMSKLDLAKIIQHQTKCKFTMTNKTDPDQRDYIVSSEKIYKMGYIPTINIYAGIKELIRYYQLTNLINPYITQCFRNDN